jgi:hydroxyacylglutathione hydrolase
MQALDAHPHLTGSIERITVGNLSEELLDDAPFVLDVRSESEWSEGRIDGSYNVPLTQLRERIDEIPKDVRLVAQCRTGYRSSIAASILAQRGYRKTLDLVGGIEAWDAAGFQTVADRPAK